MDAVNGDSIKKILFNHSLTALDLNNLITADSKMNNIKTKS